MFRAGRLLVIAACVLAMLPSGAVAKTIAPLPASDYVVKPACRAPAAGRSSCLALELQPRTPAAWWTHKHPIGMRRRAPALGPAAEDGVYGLRPADLRNAYFHGEASETPSSAPQTIALIDAYNDYEAEADLRIYSGEFGLPQLTRCAPGQTSACFEQVNQRGEASPLPFPSGKLALEERLQQCGKNFELASREACYEVEEAEGWAVETSTDIEMAHAICQNCKILLVEAGEPSDEDLTEAEEAATRLGATAISNSWGGGEPEGALERSQLSAAFDHPGTVITASAGDSGYLDWMGKEEVEEAELKATECVEEAKVKKGTEEEWEIEACREIAERFPNVSGAEFPASSPNVVAVGGTSLRLLGGARHSETVWNDEFEPENTGAGGGGCSTFFMAQPWQQGVADWSQVGCGTKRAVADVAADGDPYTGVAVYDSMPDPHYEVVDEKGKEELVPVNSPLEWWPIGGTSVASPIIAGMFALAGGSHGVAYPAQTLYSHLGSSDLYDVTEGGNGDCDGDYTSCSGSLDPLDPLDCGKGALICNAAPGYDGPTGVGAPNGISAFEPAEVPPSVKEEPKPQTVENPPAKEQAKTVHAVKHERAKPRALALTRRARAALSLRGPLARQVAFTFKLGAAARAHVTLAIQVGSGKHRRWRKLPYSVVFSAHKGVNAHSLASRHRLAKGRYRLTVSLQGGGGASSIAFKVG